jgi:hypothetical protein
LEKGCVESFQTTSKISCSVRCRLVYSTLS